MLVDEYIQIAKDEFPYLFEQDFKFLYKYQGEMRDLGRFAFGIESANYHMRILFSRQQGGGMIYFGPLTASFYAEYPYPKELSYPYEWVEIAKLLRYLNQKPLDWSVLDRYQGEDQIRPSFHLISQSLMHHFPGVLEMFSSADAIDKWKPQYQEFFHKVHGR